MIILISPILFSITLNLQHFLPVFYYMYAKLFSWEFHYDQITESKMEKIENWDGNGGFDKIMNIGQKEINTK